MKFEQRGIPEGRRHANTLGDEDDVDTVNGCLTKFLVPSDTDIIVKYCNGEFGNFVFLSTVSLFI